MRRLIGFVSILLINCACVSVGSNTVEHQTETATGEGSAQTSSEKGLEKREGLLTYYLDRQAGKVWLAVPQNPESLLYVEGLAAGLGSNPVGLDRGELGDGKVIQLRRLGGKLLFVQPNLRYRADVGSPEEQLAVGQSFATSVLWAGEIDRERLSGVELVDLTPFLVRDAHNVSARLERVGQGVFKLDPDRSVLDLKACLSFPDNLEFEALLTYSGEKPGRLVRETTPTPQSMTLVQHHSFIRLPDNGYQPRVFDPRAGSFEIQFADYAASLADTIERRWIVRHRLQRQDAEATSSLAVEPIVYYVDPSIPEPIRGAVLDGVGWWAEAFEKAGFQDAFRVELLPADAHPLDVRYHVVQWVHRSTRGWSYGGGIVDPRTGEMLKGHVRLGSLRVRQDRLLFEGLAGTANSGTGAADDPVELALARIRQLAAHEVGHTLGLSHNFAASTFGGRASVMDYPAPLVRVAGEDTLDFGDAYGVGVGEWDVHSIRYAYSQFAPGLDGAEELERLIDRGIREGLVFLTDQDARPAGAAQPLANLWDNGQDPVSQLEVELEVRRLALTRFGEDNVPPGTPLALLEEVLVPLYLHHRYQLTAAIKTLGGVDYRYKMRGDAQPPARPIAAEQQRRALRVALRTLEPQFLDLPDEVLNILLPRPAGYRTNREMLDGRTAPIFDPLAAAATAADATVRGLVQRERAARMVDFHRRDPSQPDFSEVLHALQEVAFGPNSDDGRLAAIRRRVQSVVVVALIDLAADPEATPEVRELAEGALEEIRGLLDRRQPESHLARAIERFSSRITQAGQEPSVAREMPPGQPIGGASEVAGWSSCSW